MAVDIVYEVWQELKRHISTGDRAEAADSLVNVLVDNVGMVCTNHTYASQDMFDPDDKISGGQGFIYASSIVVAMRKLKLKEDEDG